MTIMNYILKFVLFLIIFAGPVAGVYLLIKEKRLRFFYVKYGIVSAVLLVLDAIFAITSPDFYGVAFAFVLFLPYHIILMLLFCIVGIIVNAARTKFFTKAEAFKMIGIAICIVLVLTGFEEYRDYELKKDFSKYPNITFCGKNFNPYECMIVKWNSTDNTYKKNLLVESIGNSYEKFDYLINNPDDYYVSKKYLDGTGNFYYSFNIYGENGAITSEVYRVNIASKKTERIIQDDLIDDFETSPLDNNLIYYHSSNQIKIFNISTGETSVLLDNTKNDSLKFPDYIIRISDDGRFIMYCKAIDYDLFLWGFDCVYVYDTKEGTTQEVIKTDLCEIDVDSLKWEE